MSERGPRHRLSWGLPEPPVPKRLKALDESSAPPTSLAAAAVPRFAATIVFDSSASAPGATRKSLARTPNQSGPR